MRQRAHSGIPTSFSVPVVAPGAEMGPKAALGAAPEVVGEPDRGDGRDRGHDEADDAAHERQPQAAEAPALRRERRKQQIAELAAAVDETGGVAARGAVLELQLHLPHVEPGAQRVDRHPRLDAEPRRHGEELAPCLRRQRSLARERLVHPPPAAQLDQRPRHALRDAEPAARPSCEHRDDDVSVRLDERPQVTGEVRVTEEQRPLAAHALGERQRLSLAAPRQAHDASARGLRLGGGPVARAVVGHDDLRAGERLAQRRDRPPDPLGLVPRGDEHRQTCSAHPLVVGGGGGGSGRTPSTAVSSTP